MGLLDTLMPWRKKAEPPKTQIKESLFSPFGFTLRDEDSGFRSLSGRTVERDLDVLTQEKALRLAYYLYMTNPTARRIVQVTSDFVIGAGINPVSENPEVQADLDEFWQANELDQRQGVLALELGLFGEQVWPVWIGANGMVKLGNIDPLRVQEVVVEEADLSTVVGLKVDSIKDGDAVTKTLTVIRKEDDGFSPQFGAFTFTEAPEEEGDPNGAFFFRVNHVSNALRGTGDLLPITDWLDVADQLLFGMTERSTMAGMLLWDVEVDGPPEKVEGYAAEIKRNGGLKPGMLKVHDKTVKWDLRVPAFGSSEYKEAWQLIRQQILAGAGLPEHWIFEGGNVNKATAAEMSEPVLRRLRARQSAFVGMLTMVCEFYLAQRIRVGSLNVPPNEVQFELIPDRVGGDDMTKELAALDTATDVLIKAENTQLVDHDDAAQSWQEKARSVGLLVMNDDEVEVIDPEAEPVDPDADIDERVAESAKRYAEVIDISQRIASGDDEE